MNKYLRIGFQIVLGVGILVTLGFVSSEQAMRLCDDIQIKIDHSSGNHFIEEEDIYAMVYHEVDTVLGRPMQSIKSESLEYKINNHPSISDCQVFKTLDGKLVIEVKQRTPIVRIFTFSGDSYYIDNTGRFMPTSSKYTARVLVANGFVYDDFVEVSHLNASQVADSLNQRSRLSAIYKLAEFVNQSKFWSAQIEQLYVNKDFELELIPRVGNHRIVFGDAVNIEEKFQKLKIFYKKGLSKTGWNEYSTINLKYADQVVCTKRL